jgi:hypothetical protein
MIIDFDEPNGLGWAAVLVVIALGSALIVGIIANHDIKTMKMALDAGCEQVYLPGRTDIVWANCKCPQVSQTKVGE